MLPEQVLLQIAAKVSIPWYNYKEESGWKWERVTDRNFWLILRSSGGRKNPKAPTKIAFEKYKKNPYTLSLDVIGVSQGMSVMCQWFVKDWNELISKARWAHLTDEQIWDGLTHCDLTEFYMWKEFGKKWEDAAYLW